ncbi:MAG: tetratricopeptide repeat protein [Candidatus Sulfotelmatobacter sp.]
MSSLEVALPEPSQQSKTTAGPSPVIVALLLFTATLLLYIPSFNNDFVNYDDGAYVTSNSHVLQGVSWKNIKWAFTATIEANWHPLTWISHMEDAQLFGTNPIGHHFHSVVLHALNVVLLFLVLLKATGYLFRSAFVAALFAVHPLNVECVAWIAERKSLLSMFFLLLALLAYEWYASHRNWRRYAVVVVVFVLGLATKPMVVTLPVLLLLWDYWPRGRTASNSESASRPALLWLGLEKVPLLALSAASAWITLYAQHVGGALGSSQVLPLSLRIQNASYSYAVYLGKGIWPSRLAVFYPYPESSIAAWKVLAAAILILGITAIAWKKRQTHRYLLTGWLWYLVAMLPMIGIVQVGRQAMADRYAYLPFVGLFIVAVWGGAELFAQLKLTRPMAGAIVAASLVAYGSVTLLQIRYWRDSYSLFSHTLAVTRHNGVAEQNLGTALMDLGLPRIALPHFEAAVEFAPTLSTAHYNLGVLRQQQNQLDAAKHEYQLALNYSSDPIEITQTHNNLGFLLMNSGDLKAAEQQFTAALQVNPQKQNSLLGRGIAEYREKNYAAALQDLSSAAKIAAFAPADFWLGRTLEERGDKKAASEAYEAALQLMPDMAEAQQRLSALRQRR